MTWPTNDPDPPAHPAGAGQQQPTTTPPGEPMPAAPPFAVVGRRPAAVISCDVLLGPDPYIRGLVYDHGDHGTAVIDLGGCRLVGDRDDLDQLRAALSRVIAALDQAHPPQPAAVAEPPP